MTRLQKKYEEYKRVKRRYLKIRDKVMLKPLEKLQKVTNDLCLNAIEETFNDELRKKMKKAWKIYSKLYDHTLTKKDIERFVDIAEEVMEYDEFLSESDMKVWEVSRDLVVAYSHAFVGTEDEYNQAKII